MRIMTPGSDAAFNPTCSLKSTHIYITEVCREIHAKPETTQIYSQENSPFHEKFTSSERKKKAFISNQDKKRYAFTNR